MSTDDNPFQSPQVTTAPIIVTDRSRKESWATYPFVSGHTRAMWAVALLALGIMADLTGAASTALQVDLLNRAATHGFVDDVEAEQNDLRQGAVGLTQTAIFLATAIAFLMWTHRAYRNLPSLDATGLQHSPAWAVGYFFIPLFNLFRPYQAMREIWVGSHPRGSAHDLSGYGLAPSAALVGWWWGLWLVMNLLGQINLRLTLDAQSIDSLLASSWGSIATDLVSVPAALVAILMVRRIDANQQQRHEEIAARKDAPTASPFSA